MTPDEAVTDFDPYPAAPDVPPEPPYGLAALAALALFLLYAVTLAPTTAFWDASEYIATAHILGIPHPPGNPLFVFLGRVWILLLEPTGLSVAVRVNLLAAATSAVATVAFFLVAHRVLVGLGGGALFARAGAGAGALLGGTAFTVWNQSNVNEKVYTLSVMVIALVSWLALRWQDERERPGSERYLLWIVFLLALGSTNHLMSVLPVPALVIFVALVGARPLLRPAFLTRAALLGVLGLSFNFVLPVRAEQDPVINEGDPVCESVPGAALAIYTHGAAGCALLADNLTRRQYQPPPVTERKAPFRAQLEMWWQYFEWQWARGADTSELPGGARLPFAILFLALGVTGLATAWRSDRKSCVYLAVLVLTLTLALVYYLNFRYGYSLAPEVTDRTRHEVRERDYFFIAGFMAWGVLAGVGLAGLWGALATAVGRLRPNVRTGRRPGSGPRALLPTAPVLALAFLPLLSNWSWASRAGDYAARDWAYDLLASVEPYAVLFTNGDNDTFPLWYLQEVEGIRRDVTVVVGQYLYTTWYPKQLRELTGPERQRPFEADAGAASYRPVPTPGHPVLGLTPDEMDQVGSVSLDDDLTISFPRLAVTYPAGMVLDRSHQMALSIIHDSIDERPIYFSAGGGMLADLGLGRWGVRHGLVTKLELRPLSEPAGPNVLQGSEAYAAEWFDLDHSLRLYRDVYRFRGIRDREIWADGSTLNIPWQFYALALQLSDVARIAGEDESLVRDLETDAERFRMVAQGGLRFGTPEPPGGG